MPECQNILIASELVNTQYKKSSTFIIKLSAQLSLIRVM
jgi:hypothetical protein